MAYPNNVQISVNGQVSGPFTVDVIRSMLEVGSITREDHVWGEGMSEWISVDTYLLDAPLSAGATSLAQSDVAQTPNRATPGELSFGRFILDALAYPFRGDGLIILGLGTILFTVLNFLGHFSLYIMIAGWGYLLLMLQEIVHGTASGEATVPNWPDFDGFGQLLGKWFQFFVTLMVCFGPGFYLLFQGERTDNAAAGLSGLALGCLGLLYFPMAVLGVAMYDSLAALNPMLVLKSIVAIKGHYLMTLAVLAVVLVVQALTTGLSQVVPYIGHLIDELDALWSAVFVARILGGLYLVNRHKLGWF